MAADQILSNLDKIIELSASMRSSAREGDWEQVQEIEQQRKKIFDLIFPLDQDSITDATEIARQIRTVSDLDKETIKLVEEGSKGFSKLAGKITTGRQAVNAYRKVEGR